MCAPHARAKGKRVSCVSCFLQLFFFASLALYFTPLYFPTNAEVLSHAGLHRAWRRIILPSAFLNREKVAPENAPSKSEWYNFHKCAPPWTVMTRQNRFWFIAFSEIAPLGVNSSVFFLLPLKKIWISFFFIRFDNNRGSRNSGKITRFISDQFGWAPRILESGSTRVVRWRWSMRYVSSDFYIIYMFSV